MNEVTTGDSVSALGCIHTRDVIARELGFGTILLENDDGELYAVLPFVPGYGEREHRWVMAKPAHMSGQPTRALITDSRGRLWHEQGIGDDVRLTQEYAVKGEPINVCEWRLRIADEVVLTGRGVRYDGYRMEG